MATRTNRTRAVIAALVVMPLFMLGLAACDPAPVVSNVSAGPTTTTALIYWNTDVASSSQVLYGLTSSYGSSTTLDSTGRTSHLQNITGLAPSTTYHYKVQSATSTSLMGESPDMTFTTDAADVSTCDPSKGYAGELCWYNATGVLNTTTANANDRWTEAQIKAGAASAQLDHVTAVVVLDDPTDFNSGSGTAADPYVYQNHWVTGAVCNLMNNVVVKNVLIDMTRVNTPCGNCGFCTDQNSPHDSVVFQDSEVDGQWSTACAVPPWPACDVVYNTFTNNVMDMTGPFKALRLNVHGGYVAWGYPGGVPDGNPDSANLIDSYMHDLGNFRNWGPGDSRNCSGNDAHREVLHFEFASNWLVQHSFLTVNHPSLSDRCGGAITAGLFTGQHTGGWAVVNSYINGEPSFDLVSCNSGDHQKTTVKNLYLSDRSVPQWQCGPPLYFSDYAPGSWTESYTTSPINTLTPIIDHSYCNNIYRVSSTGTATKIAC